MKLSKKPLVFTTTFAAALLAGCQSQSNILTFATPTPTAVFNTNNQTAAVNVMTQDLRTSREIASYIKNGELIRLTAVPEVAAMFQQAVQQDLNAKGFQIVQGAANANVTVKIFAASLPLLNKVIYATKRMHKSALKSQFKDQKEISANTSTQHVVMNLYLMQIMMQSKKS